MKTVFLTGATGFVGQKISRELGRGCKIIALENVRPFAPEKKSHISVKADITDFAAIKEICDTYKPDVVIHCAGLAHQKIRHFPATAYHRVNARATENVARAAGAARPDVYFIFLSSISVYGESSAAEAVSEDFPCSPSGDYARSKRDAEKYLVRLFHAGKLRKLDILRLAPVYDASWRLNLNKRVLAPKTIAYLKFGSGRQRMSAVARKNVVDFIHYRLQQTGDLSAAFCEVFNVCDERAYPLEKIIQVFKKSAYYPARPVIRVPLCLVWLLTRSAGLLAGRRRQWIHAGYAKLAYSLVFDNSKMLTTGFQPVHTLESVFLEK